MAAQAIGTGLRDRCLIVTLVAGQDIPGNMVSERDIAMPTAKNKAAPPALHTESLQTVPDSVTRYSQVLADIRKAPGRVVRGPF